MGSPSPRWLAARRREGTLPVARGAVASFALVGLVVASPLVLAQASALPALTERALSGRASLLDAALVLGAMTLPALAAATMGALVGGALHVRVVGRGGGAPAHPTTGTVLWLVTAAVASATLVSDLRTAVEGGAPTELAATMALRIAVVAAVVALVAAARAIVEARGLRDARFSRDRDPDAAREQLVADARQRR